MKTIILKGNILHSISKDKIEVLDQHFLISEEGKVVGIFRDLPSKYEGQQVADYGNKLIIPGLVDMHIHAPQYAFRGLNMDLELLPWLNQNAFAEEMKYHDEEYATKAYAMFADDLINGATTRANIFATIHNSGTLILMEMLEKSGLKTLVGKVNMDRNAPDALCEKSAKQSVEDTKEWLKACSKFHHTKPILTPRFIPSCTDELMEGLGNIQRSEKLPVQSHLSENKSEIEWVSELHPETSTYGGAYEKYGLFGGVNCKTVMAHCVYSPDEEIQLMAKNDVFVAHCPNSNTNLSSGIAPVRKYLDAGVKIGLGSDVAGGFSASMLRAMSDTIQNSKLYWRLVDEKCTPLHLEETFFLATKGGGEFFGKVGCFDEGYEFDALVLDDADIPCPYELTSLQRLERIIYLGTYNNVVAKYVQGSKVKG
jgi:Cytosine deaminase and related metal-dependent hydrolases